MSRASSKLSRRALTVGSACTLSSAAWLGVGAGCAADARTGGRRVELTTLATTGPLSFVNAYGISIEIERALLSVGPLRYLEGAPVAGTRLRRWLAIPEAHAHPGHYVEGGVLGEMLEPATVDLALGPTLLGTHPGVTGAARSARFSFQSPAVGALAPELGDSVVLVDARAERDDRALRFRISASAGDVLDADGQPFVAGCPFEAGAITSDGSVELTVSPSLWFDQVELGELTGDEDERLELPRGGLPHKAFVRGLKKAGAYAFAYQPEDEG